jgi:tyrosyl-tRNA synthetase
MDSAGRAAALSRVASETLTAEELVALFAQHEHPRAYIGFEPSGPLTVGQLVCIRAMRELLEQGCELTVFLADWHAWINDKFGGSMERITEAGHFLRATFAAFGLRPEKVRYRWASELVGRADYWARVVRVAKATSLARTKRAMTVLGRSEEEAQLDTAKLFYPAMQAADIFELPVEIALAGLDQRRAHVLAREVAHHYDWPVPVALHTPLIPSLKGSGRMDATDGGASGKMSKSDPGGAIRIPSTPEEIAARVQGAFCEPKQVEGNPIVELARHVLLPWTGTIAIERAAKHGGPVSYASEAEFLAAWRAGALHPSDLKSAVTSGLTRIIEPASRALASMPRPPGPTS